MSLHNEEKRVRRRRKGGEGVGGGVPSAAQPSVRRETLAGCRFRWWEGNGGRGEREGGGRVLLACPGVAVDLLFGF